MANIAQTEHIAPASRVHAALFGVALTVLALVGGLMAGFMVGSMTFQAPPGWGDWSSTTNPR